MQHACVAFFNLSVKFIKAIDKSKNSALVALLALSWVTTPSAPNSGLYVDLPMLRLLLFQ
jgi:hypothetical protein